MYAGSQSVVASLWPVDDSTTAELMKDFYKELYQEMPKDEALRQAKLKLLNADLPPAYWAPFISIGNPAAITDLEGAYNHWKWLFLLLVLVSGVVVYRKL